MFPSCRLQLDTHRGRFENADEVHSQATVSHGYRYHYLYPIPSDSARYAIQIPTNHINTIYCEQNVSTLTPSSERAPFPQLLSELPQQKRRRQSQRDSDEPQHTVPPTII